MELLERVDVVKMLHNQGLMDDIIGKVLADQDVISRLANDIVNEVFESDIKDKIIQLAITNQSFKQRIINKVKKI